MVVLTASYLWIALHFHDVIFNWWIAILLFIADLLIVSSMYVGDKRK